MAICHQQLEHYSVVGPELLSLVLAGGGGGGGGGGGVGV